MAQPAPGDWKSDLCGYTDNYCNCAMVICCPCVTYGQISERVGHNGCCADCGCCMSGALFALVATFGFGCVMEFLLREKVAQATGVEITCCTNACLSFFCGACTLCQMANQVEIQQDGCSFGAPPRMEKIQRI